MSRVAKRYAKALFELAEEEKILNKVEADVAQFASLSSESAEFSALLSNPLINEKEKFNILKELFSNKVQPLTLDFLNLLSVKKRLGILPDIAQEFRAMMLNFANKIEGELISAVKLSPDQVDHIRSNMEKMTGKNVLLDEKIDKSVLGGFIVRIEDWVLDNSVRYQLSKLRDKLVAE